MNYFIEIITQNKAKTDIDTIYKRLGYTNLTPMRKSINPVSRFFVKLVGVLRILTKVRRGDTLFLQYPMKKFYYTACTFAHLKNAKVVTIIHDLGAFRRHKLTPEQENKRLSKTDFLIAHNETMKQYLIDHGFKNTIVSLGIFDYLSETDPRTYATPHKPWRVVYAGGLHQWRNPFLYKLQPYMKQWQMELYGPGFKEDGNKNEKLHYHGNLKPEELMQQVEADFGLVWDGSSLDECDGDWGTYLKSNNPHKTSFCIRAGIPVIVWTQAAMKPFILENGLGFAVDSLRQIDEVLAHLTIGEYQKMREAAARFAVLLEQGHFASRHFNAATSSSVG